jgi:hypothetical protein
VHEQSEYSDCHPDKVLDYMQLRKRQRSAYHLMLYHSLCLVPDAFPVELKKVAVIVKPVRDVAPHLAPFPLVVKVRLKVVGKADKVIQLERREW